MQRVCYELVFKNAKPTEQSTYKLPAPINTLLLLPIILFVHTVLHLTPIDQLLPYSRPVFIDVAQAVTNLLEKNPNI